MQTNFQCKICNLNINKNNGYHLQAGKTLVSRNNKNQPEEKIISIPNKTIKISYKSSIPYSKTDWCGNCEEMLFKNIDNDFMNFFNSIDLNNKTDSNLIYYRININVDHNMLDKYAMSVLLRYHLNNNRNKINLGKKYSKLAIDILQNISTDTDNIFKTITIVESDRVNNGLTNVMSPDITNEKYKNFKVYNIFFQKGLNIKCKVSNQQFDKNIMKFRDPYCLIAIPHLGTDWKYLHNIIKNV